VSTPITGGFGRAELEDAGAAMTCEDLRDLGDRLDELLTARPTA